MAQFREKLWLLMIVLIMTLPVTHTGKSITTLLWMGLCLLWMGKLLSDPGRVTTFSAGPALLPQSNPSSHLVSDPSPMWCWKHRKVAGKRLLHPFCVSVAVETEERPQIKRKKKGGKLLSVLQRCSPCCYVVRPVCTAPPLLICKIGLQMNSC